MADYAWLDDIPDSQWIKGETGQFKSFGLDDFLTRSGASLNDLAGFDTWGVTRPRQYGAEMPVMLTGQKPIVLVMWPCL